MVSNISNISNIVYIFVLENNETNIIMKTMLDYIKPTNSERRIAKSSYNALQESFSKLSMGSDKIEIEIEETKERIVLPMSAMKLLTDILKAMSDGKPVSIMPVATEVTTQKAAEMLGCSRPYLVKLLEEGVIPFTKIGRHRRIMFKDVIEYKNKMKAEQKQNIIDIMNDDEEDGLYDS